MDRCLCCGAIKDLVRNVCAHCRRDALRQPIRAEKVALAEQGLPQVCMACGWDKSCLCGTPDRQPRAPAVPGALPQHVPAPDGGTAAGAAPPARPDERGLSGTGRWALLRYLEVAAGRPALQVSLDGGSTWADAPGGVRVVYPPVSGRELHVNLTGAGVVLGVWRRGGADNLGTSSETVEEIVARLSADNQ